MASRSNYQTSERAGAVFYPIGMLFIIAGLVLLNGIVSFNSGRSIIFIKQMLVGLCGVISLPFPILLMLIGLFFVVGAKRRVSYSFVFCLIVIYFLVLAFATIASPVYGEGYFMDFLERRMELNGLKGMGEYLNAAYEQFHGITKPLVGGGAIGMLIAYPLWFKFGSIGSIAILSLLIVVMFFVTIRFNVVDKLVKKIKESREQVYRRESSYSEQGQQKKDFKLSNILSSLMGWLSIYKADNYADEEPKSSAKRYTRERNRVEKNKNEVAPNQTSLFEDEKVNEKPNSNYSADLSNKNMGRDFGSNANFKNGLNEYDRAKDSGQNSTAFKNTPDSGFKPALAGARQTPPIKDIPALREEKRYKNDYYFNNREELNESDRYSHKISEYTANDEFDLNNSYSLDNADTNENYFNFDEAGENTAKFSDEIKPFTRNAADFDIDKNQNSVNSFKQNKGLNSYREQADNSSIYNNSYEVSQPNVQKNISAQYDDSFNDVEDYDYGFEAKNSSDNKFSRSFNVPALNTGTFRQSGKISDVHTDAAFEITSKRISIADDGKKNAQGTLDGQTATPLKGGLQLELEIENYVRPNPSMLRAGISSNIDHSEDDARISQMLVNFFDSMGVEIEVTNVIHGPSITRFGVNPGTGVRVDKVLKLSDDLLNMFGGKRVNITLADGVFKEMGIEIPNERPDLVTLRDVLFSQKMLGEKSPTMVPLGKNLVGETVLCEITAMPHLLIAGETGSGKSACINSIITSLIYRADPKEVRLILVDPKQVEFVSYDQCPHLLLPIINEPKRAVSALEWLCDEMERRYITLKERRQKNIFSYNSKLEAGDKRMPYIIMIIDELSDLMITSGKTIEIYLQRLTAKARAAGIYLILATQRPSVNVITGVIKANMPSRIAFRVSSNTDSRTILDESGADKLVGKGDMLFSASGSKLVRVQGSFITEDEINSIMDFVRENNETVKYNSDIMEYLDKADADEKIDNEESENDGSYCDPLFREALALAVEEGQVSISRLQRAFKVGFSRGGRLVDEMEQRGFVGKSEGGSKPRKMLISREEYQQLLSNDDSRLG